MHVEQALERYGPLVMSLIWRINQNQEETADLYDAIRRLAGLYDRRRRYAGRTISTSGNFTRCE